jgi:hypothetical protein
MQFTITPEQFQEFIFDNYAALDDAYAEVRRLGGDDTELVDAFYDKKNDPGHLLLRLLDVPFEAVEREHEDLINASYDEYELQQKVNELVNFYYVDTPMEL